MEEKMDLRIKKTYLSLHNAFVELLEEKCFEELTVNELCDRAMIRRTTFYEYMKKLEIHGYLVWKKSNVYDFYTTARPADERSHPDHHNDSLTFESDPPCEPTICCESAAGTSSSPENIPHPQCEPECSPGNIVIDNIYRIEDGTNKYIDKADACIRTHPTPIAEKNSPSLPVPRRMRHWPGLD